MIANTTDQITAFALLSLKGRLKLESVGMKCSGTSALSLVKRKFPELHARTAKDMLPLYVAKLRELGILS
jgi:hypothetical protein